MRGSGLDTQFTGNTNHEGTVLRNDIKGILMRLRKQPFPILLILTVLFAPPALGQDINIEIAPGLYITTLETPKGRIRVYLPDGVAVGDTISGTAILEPAGNTEVEQKENSNDLDGYFVALENQKIPLTQTRLRWTIPSTLTGGATFIVISDKDGNELNRAVVPIRGNTALIQEPIDPSQWEYECPTVGRAGKPIQIQGPFDGNFDTTDLRIGGKEVRLIAESPRKLVLESPEDVFGSTQIELKEGAVVVKRNFNNLRVVKIGEEAPTFSTAKQPIKVETEKTAKKEEVQVKETPVPPKGVKEQTEPGISATKEQPSIPSTTKEQAKVRAEKQEYIKKDLSYVTNIKQTPSSAKKETKSETAKIKEETPVPISKKQPKGKTEKKETAKEDFLPEQTPASSKEVEAKVESKATAIEKQVSIAPLTKELIKVEPQKEEAKKGLLVKQTPAPAKQKAKLKVAKIMEEETDLKDIAVVAQIDAEAKYSIQVASFNKENDAKGFAEGLKSRGYPVFVKQGDVPGRGTWYRVRVGKFKTVKEAELFGYDLKRQEKEIQSFLITENN